jgi:hypothetical protein
MVSLQQNQRTRGLNRFFRKWGMVGSRTGGGGDPNIVYTCNVKMIK